MDIKSVLFKLSILVFFIVIFAAHRYHMDSGVNERSPTVITTKTVKETTENKSDIIKENEK